MRRPRNDFDNKAHIDDRPALHTPSCDRYAHMRKYGLHFHITCERLLHFVHTKTKNAHRAHVAPNSNNDNRRIQFICLFRFGHAVRSYIVACMYVFRFHCPVFSWQCESEGEKMRISRRVVSSLSSPDIKSKLKTTCMLGGVHCILRVPQKKAPTLVVHT